MSQRGLSQGVYAGGEFVVGCFVSGFFFGHLYQYSAGIYYDVIVVVVVVDILDEVRECDMTPVYDVSAAVAATAIATEDAINAVDTRGTAVV